MSDSPIQKMFDEVLGEGKVKLVNVTPCDGTKHRWGETGGAVTGQSSELRKYCLDCGAYTTELE